MTPIILLAFTQGNIVFFGLVVGVPVAVYILHGLGHTLEGTVDRLILRFEEWARDFRYRYEAKRRMRQLGRMASGWAPRDEPQPWPTRPSRKGSR